MRIIRHLLRPIILLAGIVVLSEIYRFFKKDGRVSNVFRELIDRRPDFGSLNIWSSLVAFSERISKAIDQLLGKGDSSSTSEHKPS